MSDLNQYSALSTQHSRLTIAEFNPDTLNFGTVILFDNKTMTFKLKNSGASAIFVVKYASLNPAEFTVMGPAQYNLAPDSTQVYSVTFSPQSHKAIHAGPVVFTFGDGTTDTLYCFGLDHIPILDTISISRNYLVYADSDLTVSEMLTGSLAGTLDSVTFFSEFINFDPAVLELNGITNGANTPAPDWTINTTPPTEPGVVYVNGYSNGYALQGPGEILRLQFHVFDSTHLFQVSTVWDSAAIFNSNQFEPILAVDTGLVRVINSCAPILGLINVPLNGIEQNFPNPASGKTTIAYSVGASTQSDVSQQQSGVPVRISLYNSLGNLVRILADASEQPGRYQLETDVSDLSPGIYWYEFRTGGTTQELKPLVVTR